MERKKSASERYLAASGLYNTTLLILIKDVIQ